MFIFSFYLFFAIYTILFGWLFGLDAFLFTNPWHYLLAILSLVIAFILSFVTQILILEILGRFRKNKGYLNKFNHNFANSLLRLGLHLARVKVIVTGKENIPEGNFILVGNHQENWDIVILKPIFENHIVNFIAKEALTTMPIFGKWIKLLGNVFISRNPDRSAARSIVQGIKNYNDGMCMAIFPEGKRSFGNELIAFKPGAFKLAMKPKADLLIATQYDTCTVFKKFPWRRYRVYVHIHPLLPYTEYEGMKSQELSEIVKGRIQDQINIFKEQVK